MRAWVITVLMIGGWNVAGQGQPSSSKVSDARPLSYSNMHVVEEEGDIVGWDIRVTNQSNRYSITVFCGEGEIQGPIRGTFIKKDGLIVIHPTEKSCGESIELKFEAHGVQLRAGGVDFELVPQHKNFIREERWK
ncbi:MAG TPA: hypothetical protein VK684_01735 [Edaphobacter sp.]|jgi:hypothetical protein|nr:hypothetical protein [Edaphobacter sp.]